MLARSSRMVIALLITMVMVVSPLPGYAETDPLIAAPIIIGVEDGGEYSEAVTPTWEEVEGTSFEATLSKDREEPLTYEKGTSISELGSYTLTLSMTRKESGEQVSLVVSFTIVAPAGSQTSETSGEESSSEETGAESDNIGEESNTEEPAIDGDGTGEVQEESKPEEDQNTQEQKLEEEEPEEDKPEILAIPVIKGVKDGKSYSSTVQPNWKVEEGLSYEVILEKDGETVKGYEKGQEIWEGGSYLLTVTIKSAGSDSIEESEATASVNFSIEKTPYNTPNLGAEVIKKKLKSLPGNKKKMDLTLLKLFDEKMLFEGERNSDLKEGLQTRKILTPGGVTVRGGKVGSNQDQVYVYIYLAKNTPLSVVNSYIKKVINTDEKNHILTAWVELDKLEGLSSVKGVKKISLVDEPIIRAVRSEGDAIHQADKARAAFGQLGQGVKIGVISDSVDDLNVAQARGELPEVVVLQNNYPYTHSDEGIALLEIVHDLAPQAELYFHDCGGDIIAFNNAVAALKAAGVDIIVDDVGWKHEPFFEDGLIANYVKGITDEVIYVSSAGNSADLHYQGEYYDYTLQDGSHFHDFSHGSSPDQKALLVDVPWGSAIEIIMQWDDPFILSGNDFDLWAYDLTNQAYISGDNGYTFPTDVAQTYGLAEQNGDDNPLESFIWVNDNLEINPNRKTINLAINVLHPTGDSEANVELFFYPYGSTVVQEQYLVPEDSIYGHPAVPGVIAVGAIAANDPGNDDIRGYSSQGPVTIKGEAAKRSKPDLAGIDGVTVTWGSSGEQTYNFQGTSAAAPHVAAIAALLKAEYPESTPEEIRQVLKNSAIHLGSDPLPDPFEPNGVFGYGRADALAAFQAFDNSQPIVTAAEQTVTVAPLQTVSVQVDEAADVYLIRDGVITEEETPTRENLEAALDLYFAAKGVVASAASNINIFSTGLVPGTYHFYAVDRADNISAASTNPIHVVATALNTTSSVATDKTTISFNENDKATITVQLKALNGQTAGGNWIYVTSNRPANDILTQVKGEVEPIAEEGYTRFLAGEDGQVVFTVAANVEGLSQITVGLDNGTSPLLGSPMELTFYAPPVVTVLDSTATDAENQYVRLTSDHAKGEVYIVRSDMPRSTIAELEAAAAGNKGEKATVTAANTSIEVSATGLLPGVYYAYTSYESYLSNPAVDTITITDATKPVVAADGGSYTNSGDSVAVASNEETGLVYIVRDNVAPITIASFEAAMTKHEVASGEITSANKPAAVYTQNLRGGKYLAYAVDGSGNISEPGGNIIVITDVLPPSIASFNPANNAADVDIGTKITVTFSEPVLYLGDTEITDDNLASLLIFKKTNAQGEDVPSVVSINPSKTVITIQPTQNLSKGQIYFIGVNSLIEDEGGNALTGVTTAVFTTVKPSGGGGGGGGAVKPAKLIQPITSDDYLLAQQLTKTGTASLNLASSGQEMVSVSGQVIQQLAAKSMPLVIENTGVRLYFPAQFLSNSALTPKGTVEIRARRLNDSEKPSLPGNVLSNIGAAVYELSVVIRGSDGAIIPTGNFAQPVVVSMNLGGLNLSTEQLTSLKGVRFETDQSGKVTLKSLGGSYDSQSRIFNFATDHFSLYSVMSSVAQVQSQRIELSINKAEARINGQPMSIDVPPVLINNRTMVPLRFIGEALGAQFIWAESSRTVYLVLGSKNLRLVVGEKLEGLDTPPVIIAGRTMVPIRYIAEAFGAKVEWQEATKTVLILK